MEIHKSNLVSYTTNWMLASQEIITVLYINLQRYTFVLLHSMEIR